MSTVDTVLQVSREIFEDNQATPSAKLMELRGFDSLRHVQFMLELESNLKMTIDAEKIPSHATISEIASTLDGIRSR